MTQTALAAFSLAALIAEAKRPGRYDDIYIAGFLAVRGPEVAAAMSTPGTVWTFTQASDKAYNDTLFLLPHGTFKRERDGLTLNVSCGRYDQKVSIGPASVKIDDGTQHGTYSNLKEFVPWPRNNWSASIGFGIERFFNSAIEPIAKRILRDSVAPCEAPYATLLAHQKAQTALFSDITAAASKLAADHGGEVRDSIGGMQTDKRATRVFFPRAHANPKSPIPANIAVKGADAFVIPEMTVSRRVLDALFKALESGG
jgi:hypothetical protein